MVPIIGPQLRFGNYPEAGFFVNDGRLGIKSVLQAKDIYFDDVFTDPRAAVLVDAIVRHQFHHLDTRQLSMPERFETRDGAGRMDRLTTLVESAALVAKLGGTLEQIAQVMMSDINVTVDSHRLGDHLEGDYEMESTRDGDIVDYAYRSGLHDALVRTGSIDMNGQLVGSPVNLYHLATPNNPRRYDIAECPRPDPNADRTPFTFIEGLYLTSHLDIIDAVKAAIRVEVAGHGNGQTEERMGFNSRDAARLLYQLSVRHATEHWGDAMQKIVLQLLSLADKSRFANGSNEYRPVDLARTAEHRWYAEGAQNTFVANMYEMIEHIARKIKVACMPVQQGSELYEGPSKVEGISVEFRDGQPELGVKVERRSRKMGQLIIGLPKHKHREPIDSLVATNRGLKRISEEDPTLPEYASRQMRWLGSGVATVEVPWDILGDLKDHIDKTNKVWHGLAADESPEPLRRPAMPKNVLSDRIDRARRDVMDAAHHPAL